MKATLLRLAIKRLVAWFIDCLILACYAALLFVFVSPIAKPAFTGSPFSAEAMGFVLLTFPLFAYLSCTEFLWGATAGKRILNLSISNTSGKRVTIARTLIRNALKLLPWELAHFSIWHAFIFDHDPLQGVGYATLLLSYGIAIWYIASLFLKNGRTIYDKVSQTYVR